MKVIFSEACVKNCVHGGEVVSQHALQVVSQHALQVSRPTPKGKVEGDLALGGDTPPPVTDTAAGSTHPGMHSCFKSN